MAAVKIRDLTLLIIISAIIIFWNLGRGSLSSWDEALYAQVAREIYQSGNWIDLSWLGLPWADKPPLYMWVSAVFYHLFGVNEFSARLFSALCGIGAIIFTYLLTYKLYYSRRVALFSSLLLVSTWHFLWAAKTAMLDVVLTCFITFSLFLFILGLERKGWLFFSLLSFTLAFLTKGVASLIIPVIILAYLLTTRNMRTLKEPSLLWGVFFSVCILVWWHWLAFSHYGDDFIKGYVIKHLFIRTTTAVEGHSGGILTYFKVLANKGRPWGVFIFLALPIAAWRVFFKQDTRHLLPVLWISSVLLVFSLVKTKLNWYIMPLYPAVSILVAWGMDRLFRKYAWIVVPSLVFCAIIYLAIGIGVFNLDYSPEAKEISLKTKKILGPKEKVLLYSIGDPGIQFYFGDIGENISDTKLKDIGQEEDRYILFERRISKNLQGLKISNLIESRHFILGELLR